MPRVYKVKRNPPALVAPVCGEQVDFVDDRVRHLPVVRRPQGPRDGSGGVRQGTSPLAYTGLKSQDIIMLGLWRGDQRLSRGSAAGPLVVGRH